MYKEEGHIFICEGRYWIKLEIGRQRYHRYLMEEHLDRKLRSKEIVHHIDGNILNNDMSNLRVMTQSEHARMHMTGKDFSGRKSRGPHSEETKERIRQGNLGVKRSAETRLRNSEARKGITASDETKYKMSVAQKERFENLSERKKQSDASKKGWILRRERSKACL